MTFGYSVVRALNQRILRLKTENLARNKRSKRAYLNDTETKDLMRKLNEFFESKIEVPRIRVGKQQTVETLINEEALLFAKFLRNELKTWIPRIYSLQY